MRPIVTPAEMAAVDAAAPEPVEVLIERAGDAVARAAIAMLGGAYGRRVVVVAGKGNNGNDGRSAARRLRARGARVAVLDASDPPAALPRADLCIDAAYGTGLERDYRAPEAGATPVLAVDIASGVDGLTGELRGSPMHATRTVTFAALKPGLLLPPGSQRCGAVAVADIGLDVSGARAHLVEGHDLAGWIPAPDPTTHKWRAACWVIGGSPGMAGAAHLAAAAAARGGAGYVRLSTPGVQAPPGPVEVVGHALPAERWAEVVLRDAGRFAAAVIGPGLGRSDGTRAEVQHLAATLGVPLVLDGDALHALDGGDAEGVLGARRAPAVLTPHDGEFEALVGHRPGADRFAAARDLARRTRAVVLLKGRCTIVAAPDGDVLASTAGDERLATAGTGDVLAGLVAALLAQGAAPLHAAAAAAWAHGAAASRGFRVGLVASDLLPRLPEVLDPRATDLG